MDDKLNYEIVVKTSTPGAIESADNLGKVSETMRQIGTRMDEIGGKPFRINTNSLSSSIRQLETIRSLLSSLEPGNTSIGTSISALSKAGVMNTLPTGTKNILQDFGNMQNIANDPQKLNNLKMALDALISSMKTADDVVKQTKDDVGSIGDKVETIPPKVNKVNIQLKTMGEIVKEVKKGFDGMALVRLTYLFRSIKRVTSGLVEMVENAANFEESINLYRMSFGKFYSDADKWMTRITDALKLDPSAIMQYAGAFNNLVKGMGVTSEAAYTMSTNLTQLTYDMASYLNISNEAAQAKIQSAMAGQSRAVASVGVATQMASLQELAFSLGIKKKVANMTQAEKTYLRYIQLMRSTTHMQGDLGKTMLTPANAIRTLKNQLNLLSRAIGQVLTPIIMRVIPYLIAMTNVLQRAAKAIADFFGYKFTDVDYSVTFEDIGEALDGIGKSADGAGKKIKNSLAPFDELNQVMSETSGTGSGGDDDNIIGDLEKYVTGYDMLSKYTGDLVKKAESLEGSVTGILETIGVIIGTSVITDAIIKLGRLKSTLDGLGLLGIVGDIALIGGGLYTIWKTTDSFTEDIGELYALEKYGNGGPVTSFVDNIRSLGSALKIFLSGTPVGAVSNLVTGIGEALGFDVDHSDAFDRGQEKALETRLGYLKQALEYGKTIGTNAGGVDNYYDPTEIFGNLSASVDEWTNILLNGSPALKQYNDELLAFQTTTGNLFSSFEESDRQFELFGYKIQAVGELTKEESKKVKQSIDTMAKDAVGIIDANTDRALAIYGDGFKSGTILTDKEQKELLKGIISHGKSQKKEIETAQKNITKTYNKAIDERGYLTDKEYNYIESQLEKIRQITDKQMSTTETDIDYTISRISAGEKLSAEGVKNFYSALDKYREDQTKKISDEFNTRVNIANATYEKDSDNYKNAYADAVYQRMKAEEEMEKTITEYENSVSTSIAEAYNTALSKNDEYSKAFVKWIDETLGPDITKQFKTVGSDANTSLLATLFPDQETNKKAKEYIGKLLGGNLTTSDIQTMINELQKKLNGVFKYKPLQLAANMVLTSINTSNKNASTGNANGGYLENGEYFHMNERGQAEFLGSIGGQKAVVNQSQMVQSLASVITGAMANMGYGANNANTTTVYIGNKKVYEGQGEYQNRQADRYGTSIIKV